MKSRPHARAALVAAVAFFLLWTVVTWLLEGRLQTLLRPEAQGGRLRYALVANLGLGILGSLMFLARGIQRGWYAPELVGFGNGRRTCMAAAAGLLLGAVLYGVLGAPTTDAITLVNIHAQVLVVSAAEVLVCWAVVASSVLAVGKNRVAAHVAAAVIAGVLFGLYHVAHSPPFNTWRMVMLLTGVGLVTGVFFLASRDVLGTILFHNWLGVLGVATALGQAGRLQAFNVLQPGLVLTALLALAVVLLGRQALRSNRGIRSSRTLRRLEGAAAPG